MYVTGKPEWRKRHSEDIKRVHANNPEYSIECVAKMQKGFGDWIKTPEAIKERSERSIQIASNPDHLEKLRRLAKERWADETFREKTINAILKANQTESAKRNRSEAGKRRWENGDYDDKFMKSFFERISPGGMTIIEKLIDAEIEELGFVHEHNLRVGRWFIDTALTEYMIAIECDGTYWHRDRKDKDAEKDRHLTSKGWTVIRLEEEDIKRDAKGLVATRVLPLLRQAPRTAIPD